MSFQDYEARLQKFWKCVYQGDAKYQVSQTNKIRIITTWLIGEKDRNAVQSVYELIMSKDYSYFYRYIQKFDLEKQKRIKAKLTILEL